MLISALVFAPLIGSALNAFYHFWCIRSRRHASAGVAGVIATLVMLFSFGLACSLFLALRTPPEPVNALQETLFSWMNIGPLRVDFGFRFDSLSSIFVLVITGVGSLIHIYSIGYMSHDRAAAKYFAYLNLFCFMMLNLVLGMTLPHVFLGWEGVGLASYLLIGFWHENFSNVIAAQKAFIMNRIGDLGLLLAMFIAFKYTGTLDLLGLNSAALEPGVATTVGLLVFFACTGKSAQVPLFTWLPDAMAGPTPVSALIHAATMVTSGIYLLGRLSGLIGSSETVLTVIGITGAATALLAAVTACFQSDIKKVLAYSTVSQLGFMFAACGVGSFESGVFHVMTHAFFKALLFLGAGSVIHALSGNQNIFKMGGLRKALPVTFWTFAAGWAAILGLPPFSGFFSKDEIIYEAFSSPHANPWIFGALVLTAALTAFYMTRMFVLVFFGKSRITGKEKAHLHESPWVMTLPLAVLAAAAISGGWFGPPVRFAHVGEGHDSAKTWLILISVAVAAFGAWIGHQRYSQPVSEEPVRDPIQLDRIYERVFVSGLRGASRGAGRYLEEGLLQGLLKVVAGVVDFSGNMIRTLQTGSAQTYLMMILIAVAGALIWWMGGEGGYGRF
jgi:NADH-quinone oxidoreductase subunit L